MRFVTAALTAALVSTVVGCAAFKGPPGPKLYDNVVLITKEENVLLVPPTTDKEFVRVIRNRLSEAGKRQLQTNGSLAVVEICGPRTLKVTQDITGITISGETYTAGGVTLLGHSATTTRKDDIRISTELVIQDCTTGRILGSYPYSVNGKEPTDVIKWVADANSWNVYEHQHAPRQKQ